MRSLSIMCGICLATTALGQRLYVDLDATGNNTGASWTDAYVDLQDALDAARASSTVQEIWVAEGVYKPDRATGSRSATFDLVSGVELLGGFLGKETTRSQRNWWNHKTILSGDLSGDDGPSFTARSDNAYHVLQALGCGSDTLLDGFVVVGGGAIGSGAQSQGGGIRLEAGAPQISHCVFISNDAIEGGGLFALESSPVLSECFFSGNRATLVAAALFVSPAGVTINPAVAGCTFAGNLAINRGHGVALECVTLNGEASVANSVFWDNRYTEYNHFPRQATGALELEHCSSPDYDGWQPGQSGNITADPVLVSLPGPDGELGTPDDDPRMLPGSPVIDAGSNALITPDTFDLDGDGNTTEPMPFDLAGRARAYDDPFTPDTGAGSAPIVDIGAFDGPALAFVVSTPSLLVGEGASEDVLVRLSRDPGANLAAAVTVELDADVSADPSTLTYTASNWQSEQVLTISAAQDPDSLDGQAIVHVESAGAIAAAIAVTEVDDDLPPGTIFVFASATGANTGLSWDDAFADLQDALDLAVSSGTINQIWIAEGTYLPDRGSGDRSASFGIIDGVTLYGGFSGGETSLVQRDWEANRAVLSGDLAGDDGPGFTNRMDNSLNVVNANGLSATAVLDGIIVRGGNADGTNSSYFGGGIIAESGSPTLRNCVFEDNEAINDGGAAYLTSSISKLHDCTFEGNRAGRSGGGLLMARPLSAPWDTEIVDCVFVNNVGISEGGGAWINPGNIRIEGCHFEGNSAGDRNTRGGGGLAVHPTAGGTVEIVDTVFEQNSTIASNADGGGLLISRGASLPNLPVIIIDGCTFTQNSASTGGGGSLYSNPGRFDATVTNCVFDQNSASTAGGFAMGGLFERMRQCVFTGNIASESAGGLHFGGGDLSDCIFDGNEAGISGGGLWGAGDIIGCTFMNNIAHGEGPSYGGGGAWAGSESRIEDCAFVGNAAAGPEGVGGGLYAGTNHVIVRCVFEANSAFDGGGAASRGRESNIYNSVFRSNTALATGGGITLNGRLRHSVVVANSAAYGGGVHLSYSNSIPVYVENCTVFGNEATQVGGGIYVGQFGTLETDNSILWANHDRSGVSLDSQIAEDPSGRGLVVNYSIVQDWAPTLPGANSNGMDPLLFDPDGPDNTLGNADDLLAPGENSPAIDAADNSAVSADEDDIDGDGNTAEPIPTDVDAQDRFLDDPLTPDTGNGTAPIVDRGAFEFIRTERLLVTCYADCDQQTGRGVLDIFDFICFQDAFVTGDPYSDCDGNSILNIFDFLCFQDAFAAGCP